MEYNREIVRDRLEILKGKATTYEQFAERVGASKSTVDKWFSPKSSDKVGIELALQISEKFNVSLDWLYGLKEEREIHPESAQLQKERREGYTDSPKRIFEMLYIMSKTFGLSRKWLSEELGTLEIEPEKGLFIKIMNKHVARVMHDIKSKEPKDAFAYIDKYVKDNELVFYYTMILEQSTVDDIEEAIKWINDKEDEQQDLIDIVGDYEPSDVVNYENEYFARIRKDKAELRFIYELVKKINNPLFPSTPFTLPKL